MFNSVKPGWRCEASDKQLEKSLNREWLVNVFQEPAWVCRGVMGSILTAAKPGGPAPNIRWGPPLLWCRMSWILTPFGLCCRFSPGHLFEFPCKGSFGIESRFKAIYP